MYSQPGEPGLEDLQPEKVVTVLSVSGSEADHRSLGHVFRHTKWKLLECNTCADAFQVMQQSRVPVVICERLLPDGDWRDLLRRVAALPVPPLLIVTSRLADDLLWSEVMNGGGYDVLEKPFNHAELVRVVSLAWLAWKDQLQRAGNLGPNTAG